MVAPWRKRPNHAQRLLLYLVLHLVLIDLDLDLDLRPSGPRWRSSKIIQKSRMQFEWETRSNAKCEHWYSKVVDYFDVRYQYQYQYRYVDSCLIYTSCFVCKSSRFSRWSRLIIARKMMTGIFFRTSSPVIFYISPSSTAADGVVVLVSRCAFFLFVLFCFDTVYNRLVWRRLEARRCTEEEQLGRGEVISQSVIARDMFLVPLCTSCIYPRRSQGLFGLSSCLIRRPKEYWCGWGGMFCFVLFFPSRSFVKAHNIVGRYWISILGYNST